jgi:hypothetical protein
MRSASSLGSAMAVFVLMLVAPAQAAPVGGSAQNLSEVTGPNADIVQVRHRCYRHRGHWHCPRHGRYYRYYDGPGFYFNFGPRRHHHRHYRHYRRHR